MGMGRRLWSTLHEPRAISAMMAATYTLIAVAVALILGAPRIQPWDVTVGCLMTLSGCAIGAPSAWRGWWGVEGPSAALVALGLVVVAVEDLHWADLSTLDLLAYLVTNLTGGIVAVHRATKPLAGTNRDGGAAAIAAHKGPVAKLRRNITR